LQQQYNALEKKIGRLEERFIEEEIQPELYNKYLSKFTEEKKVLQDQLETASTKVSNLAECVNTAIDFAINPSHRWACADYRTKQRLQFMLFPEGICYNRETDKCRTTRINSVFLYLAYLKQLILQKESGIPELQLAYSDMAASVG